jgi:hypothetical protein
MPILSENEACHATQGVYAHVCTVFVGGTNVVFRAKSDWGDRTPTDVGFTPQQVVDPAIYVNLSPGSRPHLNLRVYGRRGLPAIAPVPAVAAKSEITLDLHNTKIVDTSGEETRIGYLASLVHGITEDGDLTIDRSALVADDTHPDGQPLSDVLKNADEYLAIRTDVSIWDQTEGEHEFDFKYDPEGDKFGAGTAFLQD